MTRIAVIADSHFDETPGGRFEECIRIHEWIAEDIAARGVDLVLHSGDLFERRSTPRERQAVADWLRAVARVAPVAIVRGNHDASGDLPLFERLRTQHPILVFEHLDTIARPAQLQRRHEARQPGTENQHRRAFRITLQPDWLVRRFGGETEARHRLVHDRAAGHGRGHA